jgi:hypothetical protein
LKEEEKEEEKERKRERTERKSILNRGRERENLQRRERF